LCKPERGGKKLSIKLKSKEKKSKKVGEGGRHNYKLPNIITSAEQRRVERSVRTFAYGREKFIFGIVPAVFFFLFFPPGS